MTESIVHVDSRKRVSLAKYVKPAQHYRVEVFEGGTIRLTPVTVYTRSELAEATSPEIADSVFGVSRYDGHDKENRDD